MGPGQVPGDATGSATLRADDLGSAGAPRYVSLRRDGRLHGGRLTDGGGPFVRVGLPADDDAVKVDGPSRAGNHPNRKLARTHRAERLDRNNLLAQRAG